MHAPKSLILLVTLPLLVSPSFAASAADEHDSGDAGLGGPLHRLAESARLHGVVGALARLAKPLGQPQRIAQPIVASGRFAPPCHDLPVNCANPLKCTFPVASSNVPQP